MLVVTCGWHRFGYPDGLFAEDEIKHGIHAGDIETSLMLAARADAVRKDKAAANTSASMVLEKDFRWLNTSRPAGFGWMTQDLHPCGAVGDARKATAEKGEAALAHGAKAFVELLREIDRFDLAALRKGPVA
jgi:creatinine amidohydrolase